jgi:molybdate-binding protein/DNA-binding transcriptional regulator YhcF (GntR family)
MEEPFLYRRIADQIRLDILEGRLKPGDRLASIREMTRQWKCTQGTVQRAYQELAQQGLLVSRAGKGTVVAGKIDPLLMRAPGPLRTASLVHQAEAFLLEALTAGFGLAEIQEAFGMALDRWRTLPGAASHPSERVLRFAGSHDSAVSWLGDHFADLAPGIDFQIHFLGSLGGLMALADGRADLAGCHLWDAETNSYNLPFIRKLFPGHKMAAVRLADRRLGWIVPPGNPLGIRTVADLAKPGPRFINRQNGSGTRVWLDAALQRLGLSGSAIDGYEVEKANHSEVARAVAEGQANVGLGLESAAAALRLDFVFAVQETYDLVMPASSLDSGPLQSLAAWLAGPAARQRLGELVGYDTRHTGLIRWVEPQ